MSTTFFLLRKCLKKTQAGTEKAVEECESIRRQKGINFMNSLTQDKLKRASKMAYEKQPSATIYEMRRMMRYLIDVINYTDEALGDRFTKEMVDGIEEEVSGKAEYSENQRKIQSFLDHCGTFADNPEPYEHCFICPVHCKVAGKSQRVPRDQGGLGLCKLIGGSGS